MLVRRMHSLKPNAHKNDVRFHKNDSRNYLKMLPKWLGMLSEHLSLKMKDKQQLQESAESEESALQPFGA